jgi:quercetin dioxygenase-like cupin family protein
VLEGAVVVEFDGKPPHTYTTGQAFEEPPGIIHIFRNASSIAPARALGFQYSAKEQPLQADVH